ncbi:NAD(P)-binding protein [Nemania abortiva]|nr:NAD(P)-binding protein [Nemania abortiva]
MSLKQLYNDARNPPADPTHLSFKNKTVLYAALGAPRLILAVRSQEKGEAAKATIARETKCAPDNIHASVNVLSTALMALLLLPKLREAAATGVQPHLCFVNSQSSHLVKLDQVPTNQTMINDSSQFDSTTQYFLVKLAAWYAVRGIVERMRKDNAARNSINDNVIINVCCPAIFARSAEQGSRSLVSATGLGPESTGKLWANDKYLE